MAQNEPQRKDTSPGPSPNSPSLLFEYQCRSGKFIRLANRIETFFRPNWNALVHWCDRRCALFDRRGASDVRPAAPSLRRFWNAPSRLLQLFVNKDGGRSRARDDVTAGTERGADHFRSKQFTSVYHDSLLVCNRLITVLRRGEYTIRTAPCCVLYYSCAQRMHTDVNSS